MTLHPREIYGMHAGSHGMGRDVRNRRDARPEVGHGPVVVAGDAVRLALQVPDVDLHGVQRELEPRWLRLT